MITTKSIAELRKARGLTQVKLAKEIGITQGALSHFETGRRKLPFCTAARIAAALGCTVDDLIRREESA